MFEHPLTYLIGLLILLWLALAVVTGALKGSRQAVRDDLPWSLGMAHGDALTISHGYRVDAGFLDAHTAVEIREYGGLQYVLTWTRGPGGPYRLTRVERR